MLDKIVMDEDESEALSSDDENEMQRLDINAYQA